MEKQIEEMAQDIAQVIDDVHAGCRLTDCEDCRYFDNTLEICKSYAIAERLDALDYRKAPRYQVKADGTLEMIPTVESVRQEVAKEIFNLIDNYIYIVKTTVSFDLDFLITSIAELKKKYIGE
jgi:hypothetical protein